MKQKVEKKAQIKRENKWIDIHDEELMINLGIHLPYLSSKDESVWTKSSYEKKMIKLYKNSSKKKYHFHSVPKKSIPVFAKITVQLHKNNKFPNSTYSKEIWQHEIPEYLSKFYITNKDNVTSCLFDKYTYNGKTYSPEERPYWPGK